MGLVRQAWTNWLGATAFLAGAWVGLGQETGGPPPASASASNPTSASMPQTTRAARKLTVSDAEVVHAMKAGVEFLLRVKNKDNWESGREWPMRGQYGGETALVTYALLHAAESLQDDAIYGTKLHFRSETMAPVVEWLTRLETEETYTAALQACALGMLPMEGNAREGRKAALERAKRYLVGAMGPDGGYSYGLPRVRTVNPGFDGYGDLSNAQYGALGMWALEDAGMAAPAGYWRKTETFWRTLQGPSGRWPYRASLRDRRERDSMGMAGIATLFLLQEFTDRAVRSFPKEDKALVAGMAWLNGDFSSDFGDLYSMYTLERIGLASGMKYLGGKDWYQELAANIVAHQKENGAWDPTSWDDRYEQFSGATGTTATSYALLFLARGRNPVLMNKLKYDGYWDSRPRDAAFLARVLSRRLERPLNWQVVEIGTEPAGWLEAPLLLITGGKDPEFREREVAKLWEYIGRGGMVVSTSDDSTPAFTEAIKKAAKEVSRGKWELRKLPPEHVLYQGQLNADLKGAPVLLGMSNGVREVWVHSPMDLGATWQRMPMGKNPHYEVPTALYFYATGGNGQPGKLKVAERSQVKEIAATQRWKLARVKCEGNWDPEPLAWGIFSESMRGHGITMEVTAVEAEELDPAEGRVAHLTGTGKVDWRLAEAAGIKRFLGGGGVLIADSGDPAFAESFKAAIAGMMPDGTWGALPPDHAIFTGKFKEGEGATIERVRMRRYVEATVGRRVEEPALEAFLVNGQPRVVLSTYEVTSGLTGNGAWGVRGYLPESARAVAENLVRWGMEATPPK